MQSRVLQTMQLVMGELPAQSRQVPLQMRVLSEERLPTFTRRKIEFAVEENDWLPAYLLLPHTPKVAPGVLCLHQTTACGKAEPAGVDGKPSLHYAAHLAERGFVALAPDYPNFGDYVFNPYENGYASATMKGIWNHRRAVDLLQSLPEVDAQNIGCIGHSLGGHNSLFVAAFDERIKAVVSCCGFTAFAYNNGSNLRDWSHKGYMPRIAEIYDCDPRKMPYDFSDIIASLAPRAFLAVAPKCDNNFDVAGVRDCLKKARPAYEALHVAENLAAIYPEGGHDFPEDARRIAYRWLEEHLGRT